MEICNGEDDYFVKREEILSFNLSYTAHVFHYFLIYFWLCKFLFTWNPCQESRQPHLPHPHPLGFFWGEGDAFIVLFSHLMEEAGISDSAYCIK